MFNMDEEFNKSLLEFPVYCRHKEDHVVMERPHSHRGYEFYFCLSGIRGYIVNDEIQLVTPFSMVMVKPLVSHMPVLHANPPYRRILLVIEETFFENELFSSGIDHKALQPWFTSGEEKLSMLQFDARVMLKLQEILMRIESELTDRTLNFEIAVKGLLLELFVCFSRSGEKSNETVFLSPEFKIRMEQILNELTKNYAMPFSAESLAREVNMSRSYMDRLFKEITGCTPNQYLIAYRVNQAKIKLVQTESSVLDIACSVGFGDLSHFYATFKRMTGVTPNQYRTMYFQACSKIGFGKHGI